MYRTRDWRRHQFEKRRRRDERLMNAFCPPSGMQDADNCIAENKEAVKKGGFARSWWVQYYRNDPWWQWLQEDKKKKKDRPLDKELEAWYDDQVLNDEPDEFFLREIGLID